MMAMTAYALLGSSRHLKVTTSSTMAVMSASVVAPLAAGDPDRFIALTVTLAMIVGILLLVTGLLRLGFLSDFLAKPVVTGFVVGVSITVIIGQLPKLFGVPSTSGNLGQQLIGFFQQLPDTNGYSLALGLSALILMLLARRIDRRIPGPLVALVVSIILVTVFGLTSQGVDVVGPVATGVPAPTLPSFPRGDTFVLITGAAGIVFLALAESIGAGRAFANRNGYRIDPDQELVAMGASNIAAACSAGSLSTRACPRPRPRRPPAIAPSWPRLPLPHCCSPRRWCWRRCSRTCPSRCWPPSSSRQCSDSSTPPSSVGM